MQKIGNIDIGNLLMNHDQEPTAYDYGNCINCSCTMSCVNYFLKIETNANSEEQLSLTEDPTMSESKWA